MARRHVTVVLTGDGGDENFAGYPRYQNQGAYAVQRTFPSFLSRLARPDQLLRSFFRKGSWRRTFRRLKDLDQKRLLYYLRITHFHENYQAQLYTMEFRRHVDPVFTVDLMLDKYRQSDAGDFLGATLDVDLGLYLPDTLMTKTDIASMAHSLEVRAPMLDQQFLEFAARIPSSLKLRDGTEGKHILKKASEPFLPHEVIYRKKMGFGVPIDHWFRHELKEMTFDTLLSSRALQRGYFRREYVESLLTRHQAGENWHYLIWNLLMLELWHLMFIDRTLTVPEEHRTGIA
jgi:asparagine synthase (glutamine-hydrolysing)